MYDESLAPDGTVRPGWEAVTSDLAGRTARELAGLRRTVVRLLADDGVTYTPTRPINGGSDGPLSEPQPWRLDPVPLVVSGEDWRSLELGLAQRAELLGRILVDLYTDQRLLSDGLVPPLAVFGHEEYLRPLVGTAVPSAHQLVLAGADLGRDAAGTWRVLADRAQAPSGAGYAMANRRVTSRALPDLYHGAHLSRLTPFFHQLRMALVDAAPRSNEDARVVVLSPGTHSETAFDQAFLASLLGFPLVEGSDLTVTKGRVWLQSMGRPEPVDVILRRVDATWSDPLELRAGSRLGVTGLVDCVRRGTVTVVNSLGSGIVENPALLPHLPRLCTELLGEELRLPSVPTWWCGDEADLSVVLDGLGDLVIRPIDHSDGGAVHGADLDAAGREELAARIRQEPHRWVAQELLPLSQAPALSGDGGVTQHPIALRTFTVRRGHSHLPMLGGLAQMLPDSVLVQGSEGVDPARVPITKDVWVVHEEPVGPVGELVESTETAVVPLAGQAMAPRMLDDLFWFGRYAERAEDLLRLVLAVRRVGVESDFVVVPGGALDLLLRAVTHLSTSYPGFVGETPDPVAELRSVVVDGSRPGTVARAVGALTFAAQGVRDQLSEDVWIVLAGIERALTALRMARLDRGNQLADSAERVLTGLLALSGITAENMVRDAGWCLLDAGRGLERALQLTSLLRHTAAAVSRPWVADEVTEAALSAAESVITFRRRAPRGYPLGEVIDLLVRDVGNPRSLAFQLRRVSARLEALPDSAPTDRPLRLVDELIDRVTTVVLLEPNGRAELADWLEQTEVSLRQLGEAISEHYLAPPLEPQSLGPVEVGGVM